MFARRVHVVPLRYERDRAVEPILDHGADVVYLLVDEAMAGVDAPRYHDEVVDRIEEAGATVRVTAVDHDDLYAVFGLVTTIASDHPEDDVHVNVSAGGKRAAIGAALGCMDEATQAQGYTVTPDRRIHEGAERPLTAGVAAIDPLPDYPLGSPSRDQVAVLSIVATRTTEFYTPKKRDLIADGLALHNRGSLETPLGYVENILKTAREGAQAPSTDAPSDITFDDLRGAERTSAYRTLRTQVLSELLDRGYVTVDTGSGGQHDPIILTETGKNTLRAFRHKVTDVVAALDSATFDYHRPPDWLTRQVEHEQ